VRPWLVIILLLPLVAAAQFSNFEEEYEDDSRWRELQTRLPDYPKPENFLPFKASAASPFLFFIDAQSLDIGKDGVVRYSLIAKSASGAINVSFEGIRCSERQIRIYAYGRSDNTWSKPRTSQWRAISSDARNDQHLILYKEFFCPVGGIIYTREEGIAALKAGRHPRNPLQENFSF
jgi:hypothetical protein